MQSAGLVVWILNSPCAQLVGLAVTLIDLVQTRSLGPGTKASGYNYRDTVTASRIKRYGGR
ncbi:hypothetical protein N7533_000152 [Penicillium manginii]|uniref:uncharacterized protein n=1 Tax=Penicillium manginii TaxID=203109 RepID=UPI002547CED9|nr:uncharacterized protein N7533_000152 [Penicillium manginii]KAJ5767569.1 hypothetical protein N7533_000152 [Penicillium manginii]